MNDIYQLFPEIPKQIQMNTNNIKILDNNMKYLDHKKESGVIGDDIDKRVSDLETKLKDMNSFIRKRRKLPRMR